MGKMSDKRSELLYPETAKEALDKFEKGEVITVVELGGLGPGYEQVIWIGIFRLIKKCHNEDVSKWVDRQSKKFKKVKGEKYLDVVDDKLIESCEDLCLSGAQAGVIKHTAFQLLMYGWRSMLMKAPKDRLIQINKDILKY